MANKRPKPERIVTKLRQIEVLMGQGSSRLNAIRQIGVVEQTYYRWRRQYGGVGPVAVWCRSFDSIMLSKGDKLWAQ